MNTTITDQIKAIQSTRKLLEQYGKDHAGSLIEYEAQKLDSALNDAANTLASLKITKGNILYAGANPDELSAVNNTNKMAVEYFIRLKD